MNNKQLEVANKMYTELKGVAGVLEDLGHDVKELGELLKQWVDVSIASADDEHDCGAFPEPLPHYLIKQAD